MKEVGKIWMNGKLVPFKDAKVHVMTHALHYSTAVFEGIRCYNTDNGSAIFRLSEHIDRLFKSAKLYSMKMKYSKKQISDAIIKTVKTSKLKECYIRPIAYCGYGAVGLTPPLNNIDVAIACWEWNMGESKAGKFSGAKCKISSWIRIDSRSQPMKAKAAANYSNAALARVEALENGYDEAIMLNSDGKIAEGSAENIFIVKDNQIMTPPLTSGVLEGITRDSVIRIIEENGGYVVETDLDREDLYAADEVFMTGTAAEVKSVAQIDRIIIGNGKPGKITKALQKSFRNVAMGKDERFLSWLTYV
jgi:branched-chain amino acid aminotransferase